MEYCNVSLRGRGESSFESHVSSKLPVKPTTVVPHEHHTNSPRGAIVSETVMGQPLCSKKRLLTNEHLMSLEQYNSKSKGAE